jgi:hypothetical protein
MYAETASQIALISSIGSPTFLRRNCSDARSPCQLATLGIFLPLAQGDNRGNGNAEIGTARRVQAIPRPALPQRRASVPTRSHLDCLNGDSYPCGKAGEGGYQVCHDTNHTRERRESFNVDGYNPAPIP